MSSAEWTSTAIARPAAAASTSSRFTAPSGAKPAQAPVKTSRSAVRSAHCARAPVGARRRSAQTAARASWSRKRSLLVATSRSRGPAERETD
jgi:hypothetical protein